MIHLELKNICKQYHDFSLKDISFKVKKGDYFMLLGPSGAGKSVILEIISGLQQPDSGMVLLNQKEITNEKIHRRNCILVFQDQALFPHKTVYDNIAFTLRCHDFGHTEIHNRVKEIATFVGIEHLLQRKPGNLSGGEAQRVAIARALVIQPEVLLLDEPLTALDVHLKSELQRLLYKINSSGQTIVHVTHDFSEAVSLSKHIAVIQNGSIVQSGETAEIFQNPRNEFVAALSGLKNFYKVNLQNDPDDDGLKIATPVNTELKIKIIAEESSEIGYLTFGERDVILSLMKTETSAVNRFQGTIKQIVPKHQSMEVLVDIGVTVAVLISRTSFRELNLAEGAKVWISFKASACRFIPMYA